MLENSQLKTIAPDGLLSRILARIEAERQALSLRQRFIFALVVFLGMVVAFVPTWRAFHSDLQRSGFGQYVSLIFSDFKTVATYWQDFTMSLLESFPIVSTIELLAVTFVALSTLKYVIKCSKGFFISYFLEQ